MPLSATDSYSKLFDPPSYSTKKASHFVGFVNILFIFLTSVAAMRHSKCPSYTHACECQPNPTHTTPSHHHHQHHHIAGVRGQFIYRQTHSDTATHALRNILRIRKRTTHISRVPLPSLLIITACLLLAVRRC